MKIRAKFIFLFLGIVLFSSCEDVIEVDLDEGIERLVIEASILKPKNQNGNAQQIRLTKTRGFFEEEITTVEDAHVTVRKSDGTEFIFSHDTLGVYRTDNFESTLLDTYTLRVEAEGEIYTAQETFIPVVQIDSISQRDNGGFSGEEIELRAYFTDSAAQENYYLFSFFVDFIQFPEINIFEDEFFDGNSFFALYLEEDLEPGDQVLIQNFGLSQQFYNYMFIVLNQAGSGGGPFQTQPSTVRGNIVNETNPDNFPYGYFNLSETDQLIYTVE